jgi:hypothetical protein
MLSDYMVKMYKDRVERTENTLAQMGCVKCSKCNFWVDKEYIKDNNTCDECTTKEDKMNGKIAWLSVLLVTGVLLVSGLAFAGGVTDDNNGNHGYILVSTGQNQGTNSIGHWTDPSDIAGLKGDKGDKGDTGATGATGAQGIQGVKGSTGAQGIQGIQGVKGDIGATGAVGATGDKGDTGSQGIQGNTGDKGDIGAKGDLGDKGDQGLAGLNGLNGLDGLNGKDVDPAIVNRLDDKNNEQDNRLNNLDKRVSRLEETKYLFETVLRLTDTAKTRIEIFDSYDVRHGQNFAIGVRFTYKMGKSYEEKMIEKTNKRIDKIEARLGIMPILEKVVDEKGNVKSISISSNGASVSGKF